jgi:putative hydrolase of the HAD superfamily
MAKSKKPTALFLDIGGVLLTNGWDHTLRAQTAEHFRLDANELNERHHLTYDTYEEGKLTFDRYLDRVIFYQPRSFDKSTFKRYIVNQAKAHSDTINAFIRLKEHHKLTVAAVSNEGRELMEDRIDRFELRRLIDFFICSCYVHVRKPDADIYQLALDIAQLPPQEVVYIDDRPMFVEVAKELGLLGIVHRDLASTQAALSELGLSLNG